MRLNGEAGGMRKTKSAIGAAWAEESSLARHAENVKKALNPAK